MDVGTSTARGLGVSNRGTVQLVVCTYDHRLDKGESLEGSRGAGQNQPTERTGNPGRTRVRACSLVSRRRLLPRYLTRKYSQVLCGR